MSSEVREVLTDYFRDPDPYWDGIGWRQADKLRNVIRRAAATAEMSTEDVVETVLAEARSRASARPAPLYVVSIGGAGSHWVGNMLGELPRFVNAAEVHVPQPILDSFDTRPVEVQGEIVDAIHLIHAWGLSGDWSKTKVASVVNTAHRPQQIDSFRLWDPGCTVVHLVRDPRDRSLSVTYRKKEYRQQSAPDLDDETYLRRKAKRNDTYLRRYRRSPHRADLELKYENVKADPAESLTSIRDAADASFNDDQISRAVFLHDADNIRSGVVEPTGNLDEGGRSRSWRDASHRDRLLMHHILAYPVDALGYPDDDCLARDRPDIAERAERHLDSSVFDLPVRIDVSRGGSAWQRLDGGSLPKDAAVRIRPREPFDTALVEYAAREIRPDVICVAGVRGIDLADLGFLARLGGVVGLDIAGTALPAEVKDLISAMEGLRWVSATDTSVEAWASSFTGSEESITREGLWTRLPSRFSLRD